MSIKKDSYKDINFCIRCGNELSIQNDNEDKLRPHCEKCGWIFYKNPIPASACVILNNKNEIVIKNFLGEKVPRVLKIKEGAKVKIDGEIVLVESCDKEIAGQVAADIEKLTVIKNRDNRIFQDGIHIINKSGKQIE